MNMHHNFCVASCTRHILLNITRRYLYDTFVRRRKWECIWSIGLQRAWRRGEKISLDVPRIVKRAKRGKNRGTRARARNPTDVASAKSVQCP